MKTLLIDGDSLIYYEAYKDSLVDAIYGVDKRVNRILEDCRSTTYHMFLTEGKCFRYDRAVTKEYKHSRKGREKPKFFNSLRGYLKDMYGAVSVKGIEADDCVSFLKTEYPDNTIVCSPDKDVLQQLPGNHYNYQMIGRDKAYVPKGFISTSKSDALHFLHLQMLMGDSTDGISGIEGVGIKTAEKMITGFRDNFFGQICNQYVKKYGNAEGINRFYETYKLVYLLKTHKDFEREGLSDSLSFLIHLEPQVIETKSVVEEEKDEW